MATRQSMVPMTLQSNTNGSAVKLLGLTYKERVRVEDVERNVDGSLTVVITNTNNFVSFISTERIEDLRQRAVS